MEDLSANKSAIQSSTALCFLPCTATFAVDGNLQTCMKTSEIGTFAKSKSVWWYVDLGDINSIYSIRIQFSDYGTDDITVVMRQRGRFAGFSLYVSNSTNKENGYRCYRDGPGLPPLDFNTTCVIQGRFVIFYNERLDGITYPTGYQTSNVYTELCEVTVTGCKNPSVYGYDCNLPCPENCQERRCYIVSGTCLGCTAGWIGEFCNNFKIFACPAGYYGLECRTPCTGHCRYNKACNHSTGVCDEGCADGWTGIECSKKCPAETYGPDCKYSCSGHCLNGVPCNVTSGSCNFGCKPGYAGEHCDKACSIGSYGLNCKEQCSNHCRHGINYCNHEDGHCETGCQDGFIGRKCNKTCDEGWYGENCSLPCSRNCVKQSCHHIQGNCLYRCEPGWMGLKCNQGCSGGTYGKDCLRRCSSHCMNSTTCNSVNGSCTEGCAPGYYGNLCIKP
ncbi:multiple epidermal growth factor-like domains protein 11 [Saccostrea echinata]|uniref:multiple epidermal growth factor-like domains protein 11 n=1 Tax=Saccostrea echinata TaxID=191078 RepID=UPI002A83D25E|nr:multiple epidermal growth factor-like domains protein 11 [Saccostrea echinata]